MASMKINLDTIARNANQIFQRLRWPNGIACPECGSIHIYNPEPNKLHICADCGYRFSDTSNTTFHSTKLPLSKWLFAIYFFAETTRGLSSYALSRLIGVSQPTAWNMLMKIRNSISYEIQIPDGAMLDEVFIGADWRRIPSFKKFQRATPPNPIWNLQGEDLQKYYRSEFLKLAAQDKKPVLGISGLSKRSLILLSIPSSDRKEFVRETLNGIYGHLINTTTTEHKPVLVTDQGRCYSCIKEFNNLTNEPIFQHEVCRHDQNKYKSENGYSSNRLESSFGHLKRMWRGVYQMWSNKYNQGYLNEFGWRYSFREVPLLDRMRQLFIGLCPI